MRKSIALPWMLPLVLVVGMTLLIPMPDASAQKPSEGRKPAWPAPQSRCQNDAQCDGGLVCAPLDEAAIEAYLAGDAPGGPPPGAPPGLPPGAPPGTPPGPPPGTPPVTPPGTPMSAGDLVCQSGCVIDGAFHAPDAVDGYPNNCQSCQPTVSTTSWSTVSAGTLCNAGSGDQCDPDELCTGLTGTCPDDTIAAAGTVCNPGSGDLCDPAEVCSGIPDEACPADAYATAGTICNAGSGDSCDPDEVCSGSPDVACPSDTIAAAGTLCRAGSGDSCDPDEVCSGSAGVPCPVDAVTAAGTVCNAGSGDACDPDEVCSGSAGAKCPEDTISVAGTVCRAGSGDPCDPDEICSGAADEACPADTFAGSEVVCHESTGACDVAENCPGTAGGACPTDRLAPSGTVCRDAAYACDEAETCDGESATCPEANDPLCDNGDSCNSDEQCSSGSCSGGVCGDGNGGFGDSCDSAVDCLEGNDCDDGICLGTFSTFCAQVGQCVTGLSCDAEGSGECRTEAGGECLLDEDCAEDAICQNGACRLALDETCLRDGECASGYCNCPYRVAVTLTDFICARPGECKVPQGGSCMESADCGDIFRTDERLDAGYERIKEGLCDCPTARYCDEAQTKPCRTINDCDSVDPICRPPVCTEAGTCTAGGLLIGAICEYDPPGGTLQDPPRVGDSPNDSLCNSGLCFKHAGGDSGPCTPARVCAGGVNVSAYCDSDSDCPGSTCTNACGRFDNPPDYTCCRDVTGVCSEDQDCCGGFFGLRAVGCGSPDANTGVRRCRELGISGEACESSLDCIRFGNTVPHECVPIAEGSDTKVCTIPGEQPGLEKGQACDPDPNVFNGYCQEGLVCHNCEQSGMDYVCADAAAPCCNNGGMDLACGISTESLGSGLDVAMPGQCCDFECRSASDAENCGACGNDCTDLGGNQCLAQGTCEWRAGLESGSYQCQYAEDPSVCPDTNPNDGLSTRCVSTGPGVHECQEYTPIGSVEWQSVCLSNIDTEDRLQCSTNSQCFSCNETCTCEGANSSAGGLFGNNGRCGCD